MAERQYIGARYVPQFANPIQYDPSLIYEPLTVVMYNNASYTSKRTVPAGKAPTDGYYWVCTGNYNAQVEQYRQEVEAYKAAIPERIHEWEAGKTYAAGDWVSYGGYLWHNTSGESTIGIVPMSNYNIWNVPFCNANLLTNSDFRSPVNQRKVTTVTETNAYTIDRWFIGTIWTEGRCEFKLENGYITVKEGFYQRIPIKKDNAVGSHITVSALYRDGSVSSGTIILPQNIEIGESYSDNATTRHGAVRWIDNDTMEYRVGTVDDSYVMLKAEPGDVSTIVNELTSNKPIDIEECQRYQVVLNSDETNTAPVGMGYATSENSISVFISLPTTLRTSPVISASDVEGITILNDEGIRHPTAMRLAHTDVNSLEIVFTCENVTVGKPYSIFIPSGNRIIIDANL